MCSCYRSIYEYAILMAVPGGGLEQSTMSQTETRIKNILVQHIDLLEEQNVDDLKLDWDLTLADYGVNSLVGVAFLELVNKEFEIQVPPSEARKFRSLRDLVNYLDSRSD